MGPNVFRPIFLLTVKFKNLGFSAPLNGYGSGTPEVNQTRASHACKKLCLDQDPDWTFLEMSAINTLYLSCTSYLNGYMTSSTETTQDYS